MADFIYSYDNDGGERRAEIFEVGASEIPANTPVALSSGKLVKCANGQASGVVGVTAYGGKPGEMVEVITNPGAVFRVEYKGTVKTSLSQSDKGVAFDYDPTDNKLNLDDTTGAWLKVVGFNNTGKYAWVMIARSVRAL